MNSLVKVNKQMVNNLITNIVFLFLISLCGCVFCSSYIDKPMIHDYDSQSSMWSVKDNLKYNLLTNQDTTIISIQRIDTIEGKVKIHIKIGLHTNYPRVNDLFVVIEKKDTTEYRWFKSYPLVEKYVYHHQRFPFSELVHVINLRDPSFCLCSVNGDYRISISGLLKDMDLSNGFNEHGEYIKGRIQSNYIEVAIK